MVGGYYQGPNPLLKGTLSSVDRDRMREKERMARAQMSVAARDTEICAGPLFGGPIRVNPSYDDRVSQQVQSTLGQYESVKHLLEEPGRLLGYDGVPPQSPVPSTSARVQPPTMQEFKKPKSSNHHGPSPNSQRTGGFAKPSEAKQNNRNSHPPPVKHGSGSSVAEQRSNSNVPPKGPPASNPYRTWTNQHPRPLPRLNPDSGHSLARVHDNSSLALKASSSGVADVENILREMKLPLTPLTEIAATPRKDIDKFIFNTVLDKISEAAPKPPARPISPDSLAKMKTPPVQKPKRTSLVGTHTLPRAIKSVVPINPDALALESSVVGDLNLSDDSENEETHKPPPQVSARDKLPIAVVPPVVHAPLPPTTPETSPIKPTTSPIIIGEPLRSMTVHDETQAQSSSSEGEDTGSDSSESTSGSEAQPTVMPPTSAPPCPPVEEPPPRWNLGRFLTPNIPAQTSDKFGQENSKKKTDELVLDRVVELAKPPSMGSNLSSDSTPPQEPDSKRPKTEIVRKRGRPTRKRPPTSAPIVQSDSEEETPTPRGQPVRRSTPPTSSSPGSEHTPPRSRGRPPRTPTCPKTEKRKAKKDIKSPHKCSKAQVAENVVKKRGRRKQAPKPATVYSSEEEKITNKVVETPESSEDEVPKKTMSSTSVKPVHRVTPAPPPGKRAPRSMTPETDPEAKKTTESPPKLDVEVNKVADKKKNDTLRKLFSIKRDGETGGKGGKGGKGGAKSGGKGGKGGKGTPGVIVVECNNERASGSPFRERSASPTPPPAVERLSLLTTPSLKKEPAKLVQHPTPNSLMCRIDLNKVNINNIDSKKRSEEIRTRTELPDTRQVGKKHKIPSKRKSDKKRAKSEPAVPHEVTPPSVPLPTVPVDHRKWPNSSPQSETETTPLPSANLVKRERRVSVSSSSSRDSRDRCNNKRKKKVDTCKNKTTKTEPTPTLPPTNHERQELRPVYYSYFEGDESEMSDTDKDQLLQEAKRLKHMADREANHTAQCMQYLEAVLFFILTGYTMEQENPHEKTPYFMYKDTLNLIKFISSKFRNQGPQSSSSLHNKLVVLSLRLQSLLHLKLFKMSRSEVKESQKCLAEYLGKSNQNTTTVETCGGSQGTPSPHSPTPSPGSVGSQSSGYSSGAPPAMANFIPVPPSVHRELHRQNSHFQTLVGSIDLWDQADHVVRKNKLKEFFIEMDHSCGPLTLHSSLIDLVRYIRHGIAQLKQS